MTLKGILSIIQLVCLILMVYLYIKSFYDKVVKKNERINKGNNEIIEAEVTEKKE